MARSHGQLTSDVMCVTICRMTTTESPLEAICRRARENNAAIVANPTAYDPEVVAAAQRNIRDDIMLTPAAVLRYS